MAGPWRANTVRAAPHVVLSISVLTFALPYFAAGLAALLRPAVLFLSAHFAEVSDCLGDRKYVFLFCSVILALLVGDSTPVASSVSGNAGQAEVFLEGDHRGWRAHGSLDAGAGAVDGERGLPGVGSPEMVAEEGDERAEGADTKEAYPEEEVEEEGEEPTKQEEAEGEEQGQEEEGNGEEEGEQIKDEEEGEQEVDIEEFRRKCEEFIEKVKRERMMEALHLVLV